MQPFNLNENLEEDRAVDDVRESKEKVELDSFIKDHNKAMMLKFSEHKLIKEYDQTKIKVAEL